MANKRNAKKSKTAAAKKSPVKKSKPVAKRKAKKVPAKKTSTKRTETVLPKDLEKRLMALAAQMDKTMDALLLQALCEFADAWEDHFRTVTVLAEEEERVQIVVKPE